MPHVTPPSGGPLLIALFYVLLGLASLVIGADVAVGGARRVGRRMGISDLVIGLTVTAIGTSLPELATTAAAAVTAQGAAGHAAGEEDEDAAR